MKKFIGYIAIVLILIAIFLSVIFWTMTRIGPQQVCLPPCNNCNIQTRLSNIYIQKSYEEFSKYKNGEETREDFIKAFDDLQSKYLQEQSPSIQ